MSTEIHDQIEPDTRVALESSGSTAFYMWLLITVSAGIIMAQDTWVSMHQPRLGTTDATAAFTKVLVIHGIWLLVSIGFMAFTWIVRPTSAWKLHMGVGTLTLLWTIGVLVWAFQDVERIQITTWSCDSHPTAAVITDEFLDSCSRHDVKSSIRMGGDIYMWSANDKDFWRWIVPGEGMATLQTRWPADVGAIYMSTAADDALIGVGSVESIPGGNWSSKFDPHGSLDIDLFYIETPSTNPEDAATPTANSPARPIQQVIHEPTRTVSRSTRRAL